MSKTKLTVGLAMCVAGLLVMAFFWMARCQLMVIARSNGLERPSRPLQCVIQIARALPPYDDRTPAVVVLRCQRAYRTGLALGFLLALGGFHVVTKAVTDGGGRESQQS